VGTLDEIAAEVGALESERSPRWTWWSAAGDASPFVATGARLARCWDIAEAHRLAEGGWEATPQLAWAAAQGLDLTSLPRPPSGHLFDLDAADGAGGDGGDADGALPTRPGSPIRTDGYLLPDAGTAAWPMDDARLVAWAEAALVCASAQETRLAAAGSRAVATVTSESAAALLCVELARDGLPVDRRAAEELISQAAGPRPQSEADTRAIRAARDREVLRHAPGREGTDLRNPLQVRELLASVGVVVPNTRKWVLEPFRETHPLVAALLEWRRAERIATTYGYAWLDAHVGPDDRLRGGWTACDGAAGRMTAQNGLHNLPTSLRPAVAARPGHVFVRADLGQIEPRVLAAVSGDRAFAAATRADDLYAPVAASLGVERPVAKVAVLAAMYGQRSGAAGEALRGLERAYPAAMAYLDRAYAAGVRRQPLRTFGGRAIPLARVFVNEATGEPARRDAGGAPPVATPPRAARDGAGPDTRAAGQTGTQPGGGPGGPGGPVEPGAEPARDAARGRFARNAVVQGAAAELFKAWAATVRAMTGDLGAQIVLCLHDELLLHVPEQAAEEVRRRVATALDDSARRWTGSTQVRFVADTSIVRRWSDAKG
jgi:DNA polymerase-1